MKLQPGCEEVLQLLAFASVDPYFPQACPFSFSPSILAFIGPCMRSLGPTEVFVSTLHRQHFNASYPSPETSSSRNCSVTVLMYSKQKQVQVRIDLTDEPTSEVTRLGSSYTFVLLTISRSSPFPPYPFMNTIICWVLTQAKASCTTTRLFFARFSRPEVGNCLSGLQVPQSIIRALDSPH